MSKYLRMMVVAVAFTSPLAAKADEAKTATPKEELVCVSSTMDENGNSPETCFKRSEPEHAMVSPEALRAAQTKGAPMETHRIHKVASKTNH